MSEPVTKLKRIEFKVVDGKTRFAEPFIMANGTKYFWSDSVSFERLSRYEELVPEISLSKSLLEIHNEFVEIVKAANRQEFANIVIIANNAIQGIRQLDDVKRIAKAFEMVSLFMNAEGEDIRYVDHDMIKKKYHDICEEGFDPNDFFSLAMAFIPGFIRAYEEATRGTFLKEKTRMVTND